MKISGVLQVHFWSLTSSLKCCFLTCFFFSLKCWILVVIDNFLKNSLSNYICFPLSHFTTRKCYDERPSGLTGQAEMPECLGFSATCQMVSGWHFVSSLLFCVSFVWNTFHLVFSVCCMKWRYLVAHRVIVGINQSLWIKCLRIAFIFYARLCV